MKNLIFAVLLMVAFTSCKKEDVQPEAPAPQHPKSIQLESIVLIGFDETDNYGNYWDSSTNPPEPYAKLSKSGAVVYISTFISTAAHNATYPLNTGATGELPVIFSAGEEFILEMRDNDGSSSDWMGNVVMEDPLNFFYNDDFSSTFEDVIVATSNGSVQLQLSGRFIYD